MGRMLNLIGLCLGLAGCEAGSARQSAMGDVAMRWDSQAMGETWTAATRAAVLSHGYPLVETVPGDIVHWCPAYPEADAETRALFWTGLISALAYHESTWNPRAVGGGGRWFGLLQIAPGTARGYGCKATTGPELQNGAANLSCGVRIMASTVARDGVVSQGMRGVAADWGPFYSQRKRRDMIDWVSSQPFCVG